MAGLPAAGLSHAQRKELIPGEVLDISILGAGLEIFEPAEDELIGREITVEVETPAGASITLRIRGETRNIAHPPMSTT
jgi:hypothetical protein